MKLIADVFGPDGLILIGIVLVVLFGGSQLPKLARSLGSASHEFKKGAQEGAQEGAKDLDDPETSGTQSSNGSSGSRSPKAEDTGSQAT